jgi:hypothetical protein
LLAILSPTRDGTTCRSKSDGEWMCAQGGSKQEVPFEG